MKHSIVLMTLSALLWTAPALGQPGSRGEPDTLRERRLEADIQEMPLDTASLEYTIAVIALGGLGLLVSLGILCMSAPTLERKESDDEPVSAGPAPP